MNHRLLLAAALAALLPFAAACGSDDDDDMDPSTPSMSTPGSSGAPGESQPVVNGPGGSQVTPTIAP